MVPPPKTFWHLTGWRFRFSWCFFNIIFKSLSPSSILSAMKRIICRVFPYCYLPHFLECHFLSIYTSSTLQISITNFSIYGFHSFIHFNASLGHQISLLMQAWKRKEARTSLKGLQTWGVLPLGGILKYFELDYASASATKGKIQQRNQNYYRNYDSCWSCKKKRIK